MGCISKVPICLLFRLHLWDVHVVAVVVGGVAVHGSVADFEHFLLRVDDA